MESLQKTFLQFYRMIVYRALHRAWEKVGAWGTPIGIIASIAATILIGKPQSFVDFFRNDAVIAGVFILAIFFIVLVLFIVREPVIIHNEQASTIESLSEKWGGERIMTEHVSFVPEEDNTDKNDLRAWLRVVNGEDYDLDDCYASAIRVMAKSGEIWTDRTHEANKSETELIWPAHGRNTRITIRRNRKSERLSVALLQSGRVHFTHLHTGNKIDDGLQDKLYVEIELNAEINGKQIEPLVFKGFLVHGTEKKPERLYLEPGKLSGEKL